MYTEHLRIPVGSGALHVERVGRAGRAVVLLHGFGTCAFLWRAVAPALASAGRTVVSIDLLGFGESDRPADVPYSLPAQAEYVDRALTALRLGAVCVAGQDTGALVALLLAAQAPDRVRKLALLEPPAPDDLPGAAIRSLQRTSALSALSANSLFGARPLLEPLLTDAVGERERMPERLVMRYLAPWVGGNGAAELLQLASSVSMTPNPGQPEPDLAAVRGDVLLWCGGDTPPRSREDAAARSVAWQRLLPRARVTPLITARPPGMLVAEDTPDALVAALLPWSA
ncbi:alpha/beta fold hydrolase [Gemmatimonas sp.]|uniref:alpha/beta fold hydrolase n=1 Tax=Gemmatimonas sp. TaxID=1962908 RepID=UPI0022CA4DE5|nr:alpha/beta fold hydrolase [Gemmatimonas sp.]MCZ8204188.1 alpha/beta fold hydrolase [Gemmatimonas sp.]